MSIVTDVTFPELAVAWYREYAEVYGVPTCMRDDYSQALGRLADFAAANLDFVFGETVLIQGVAMVEMPFTLKIRA